MPFGFQAFRLHLFCLQLKYQAFRLRLCSLHFGLAFRLRLCLLLLQIRRLDSAFIWTGCSNFICTTFASIAVQVFRLCLLQIRCLNFTFIWIRSSNILCITFSSIVVRRSDFVFCRSGVHTSPSYGSDVQISSTSHLLALQFRRSDFVFCRSGVHTSPSYGSDVQISSTSHLLALQFRRSDFFFVDQAFRLRLLIRATVGVINQQNL